MKKLFALCLLVMATVTLSAKTIKEFVVTTQPQMSCQNCENKIKKNIRFEKGVTNIQTDLENQVVVVTYDADKTNEENLTNAFAKLDYKVSPTTKKADSSAAGKTCSKNGKACSKKGTCCSNDKAAASEKSCCKEKAEKKCSGHCKNSAKQEGSDCCKNKK